MYRSVRFASLILGGVVALMLAACGSNEILTVIVTEMVDGQVIETVVTVTPEPAEVPDTIIICMSQEPDSLYRMTSGMAVTTKVLMAMDMRGWYVDRSFFYESQALVDNEFPSFENGDAVIEGEGADAVLTVTYRFKDNITWSDGEPFSVDDIIFAHDVLIDPGSGAVTRGIEDQKDYEKVDDHTLRVTYPAGILDPTYFLPPLSSVELLSGPLPEHVLGGMTADEIPDSAYARAPDPVLGPYEFVEWVEGDNIRLQAVEDWWGGDVVVPNVVFRFIADTNQVLASVLSGECDFASDDGLQLTQLPLIQQSVEQGIVAYDATPALVWEHIDFNTQPPAYAENNGYGLWADVRVRQAVAYGTNRQEMTEQILYGEVEPLDSYLPADHWAYNDAVAGSYPFDPDRARELLAEAGWADEDGDGVVEATETLSGAFSCARGTWTVPAGTPLASSFHTTVGASMREQIATLFQAYMVDIGIQINLDLLPASLWFAADGPLFTRGFQIGEFAWVADPDPSQLVRYSGQNVYRTPDGEFLAAGKLLEANPNLPGELGLSELELYSGRPSEEQLGDYVLAYNEQIPDEADDFEGGNVVGWCDDEADQLLFDADNFIDPDERLPFFLQHQVIWVEQVPVVPLFQRVNVNAYGVDLCGIELGPANNMTWNIEAWYFGDCAE